MVSLTKEKVMVKLVNISNIYAYNVIGVYESYEAAIEYAKTYLYALFIEEDKDHPGFYDCITKNGLQLVIEPVR
jgi:hypothetical protein